MANPCLEQTYTTTTADNDDTGAWSDPEAGEDSGDDYESFAFGYPSENVVNSLGTWLT
jgi:hypothetical protein